MSVIKFINEIKEPKISELGGKGYSLAVLMGNGFDVPEGFIITSEVFSRFLDKNKLRSKIEKLASEINENNFQNMSKKIKNLILEGEIPEDISSEIKKSLEKLNAEYVSIRSSAVTEDSSVASFAGLYDTFLNVKTEIHSVLKNIKKCWASLFNERAISYRIEKNIRHLDGMAIIVQKMIPAEVSGVTFTVHPTKNDKLLIEYSPGLGERIVSGEIIPNSVTIERTTFRITEKSTKDDILSNNTIKNLASICMKIEKIFNGPQDIEWCISQNTIWILQSRPITVSQAKEKLILTGLGASPGRVKGKVKIILTPKDVGKMKDGEILVTTMTNPLYVTAIQKARAIITDVGGIICHAAIVARELGIPCVVGTKNATELLKNGMEVIVDGSEGKVYSSS